MAQNVGINGTGNNPDPSALLDLNSTDNGFLIPRMNNTQRDAINSGTFANSLLIFNTTDNCLQIYNDNSSTWENIHCFLNCSAAPPQPTAISGNATPCQNATGVSYSIAQIAGATSYTWTVPSGATITAGQGTTNIVVDFATTNGNISVSAVNGCGMGTAQTVAITLETIPSQPSAITGNATVCQGDNAVAYSVTNVGGITYAWSYSGSGWTCATNCTTNSITANYNGSATSGTLSVTPTNACGTGAARTKAITVNAIPSAPAAIAATNITGTTFEANWNSSAGATSYFLDVATDIGFTTFVAGFNNFNVGNVTTYNVTGLINNTTYYYRIRAMNSCGTGYNSITINTLTSCVNPNFIQRYNDSGTTSSDGMPNRSYIGGKVQGGNGIIGKNFPKSTYICSEAELV